MIDTWGGYGPIPKGLKTMLARCISPCMHPDYRHYNTDRALFRVYDTGNLGGGQPIYAMVETVIDRDYGPAGYHWKIREEDLEFLPFEYENMEYHQDVV